LKIIFAPAGGFEGNKPNPHTLARLQVALDKARESNFDFIVTTGGVLECGQTIPAAIIMKNWLVKNGIEEDKVYPYPHSADSWEDVEGIAEVMGKYPGKKLEVIVISQKPHLRRFALILRRRFADEIKSGRLQIEYREAEGELPWLLELFKLLITLLDREGKSWIVKYEKRKRIKRGGK